MSRNATLGGTQPTVGLGYTPPFRGPRRLGCARCPSVGVYATYGSDYGQVANGFYRPAVGRAAARHRNLGDSCCCNRCRVRFLEWVASRFATSRSATMTSSHAGGGGARVWRLCLVGGVLRTGAARASTRSWRESHELRVRNRLEAVEAIDIHAHVEVDGHGHNAYDDELVDATRSYFKMGDTAAATVDELAEHYRTRNAAAVVLPSTPRRRRATRRTRSADLIERRRAQQRRV